MKFYNRGRGPLNLYLRTGESVSVAPKNWIELTREQAGSPIVIKFVQKGFLVPEKVPAVVSPQVLEAPKAIEVVQPIKEPEPAAPEPVMEVLSEASVLVAPESESEPEPEVVPAVIEVEAEVEAEVDALESNETKTTSGRSRSRRNRSGN